MVNNSDTQVEQDNSSSENLQTNENQPHSNSENNSVPFVAWIKTFLGSWKFKLTIVLLVVAGVLSTIFFWQHIIAIQSLKGWAKHAQAQAIDCMIQDTNGDRYISCTAKVDEQIVPLECGTSLLNMGCRVNYGNASPSIKLQEKAKKAD